MLPVSDTRLDPRRPRAAAGPEPLRRKAVMELPPSPSRRRAFQYLLIFVTVVLVMDALIGDRGVLERLRARKQFQEVSQSIEALKQENAQLRNDVRDLRDDPSAIESLAREELGLIKPGEVLFIIKDVKPASH